MPQQYKMSFLENLKLQITRKQQSNTQICCIEAINSMNILYIYGNNME